MWLVEALRLPATSVLLCSDKEGVQPVDTRVMLSISNLTFAAFFLVEETEVSRGNHCDDYNCIIIIIIIIIIIGLIVESSTSKPIL